MVDKRIVDYPADGTGATGDLIETVDVSDTTDDATGSSKKVTLATLQTLIGGDTLPIVDTTAVVKGSADDTKLLRFEVDGLTTTTTRVITMPDQDIDLTPNTGSFLKDKLTTDLDYNSNGVKIVGQTVGGSNSDAVRLSGSNTWSTADASAESTCKTTMGIRISATEVLVHGVYTTSGLTAGSLYYVSETAGAITATAPTTSLSIVKTIAYALTTTELYVFPGGSWVENA